jgi:hypothetical protein
LWRRCLLNLSLEERSLDEDERERGRENPSTLPSSTREEVLILSSRRA